MRHENLKRIAAGVCVSLIVFMLIGMMCQRWSVFIPSSQTLNTKPYLHAAWGAMLLAGLINGAWRRRPPLKDVLPAVLGFCLFTWFFGQLTYNLIGFSNNLSQVQSKSLWVRVVEPGAAPEGIKSNVHTAIVVLARDPTGLKRPMRYRYPLLDLRTVSPGQTICFQVRNGWAGYTVLGVCNLRPNNSFKPKPLRGSA